MAAIRIANGALYSGTGLDSVPNGFVDMDGGKIVAVGPIQDMPGGFSGEIVDASGMTIMPGLIDTHMHVFHEPQLLRLSEGAAALWGANYLHSALRAGLTTVRDLGAQTLAAFGLKAALNDGYAVGPRLLVSGRAICMTGGHGWANLSAEADGEDGVRRLAREQLKAGADVIKIMATGGAGTPGEEPTSVQLGMEEIRAAVREAHNAGKPAAAHALATQGIINAIEAGVDTIEHGVFLNDRAIELLVRHDVALCPTLSVYPRIIERGPEGGEASFVIERSRRLVEPHLESITRAVAAGVRIVFGTDATTLYNPIGDFGTEIALMEEAGMTPLQILHSATGVAARECHVDHVTGTLEPGKAADVLVVRGDATRDIASLTRSEYVFREGSLVYARGEGYRNAALTPAPINRRDIALEPASGC